MPIIRECRECAGAHFRYVDWTQNPTPFDPSTPCPSKQEVYKADDLKKPKGKKKDEKKHKKIKELKQKKGDFSHSPGKVNTKKKKNSKKKGKTSKQQSSEKEGTNLPLTLEDIGISDEPENLADRDKNYEKGISKEKKAKLKKPVLETPERTQKGEKVPESMRVGPKDAQKSPERTEGDLREPEPLKREPKQRQRSPPLAQRDQQEPESLKSEPKRTHRPAERADRDGRERYEQTSDKKIIRKQAPGQAGDVPLKASDEEGKKDSKSWKPGDLDHETKKEFDEEAMWFKVQTDRYMPRSRHRPLAPRRWWSTRLRIKHIVQQCLNPFDTLRSLRNKKDVHAPERVTVAWTPPCRKRAWGCGCPGLPCICHLYPQKPNKEIPRGWCLCLKKGRLMETVMVRVRTEERLHEKLAQLPPPIEEPPPPVFCLGLERCAGRRMLWGELVEAGERARAAADAGGALAPCDPTCRAPCVIKYDEIVRSLRKEAALKVLEEEEKCRPVVVDVKDEIKPEVESVKSEDVIAQRCPAELRGDVPLEDLKRMIQKCAELKRGKPFETKIVCYRMEEVRDTGVAFAPPPPTPPPPSEGGQGSHDAAQHHRPRTRQKRRRHQLTDHDIERLQTALLEKMVLEHVGEEGSEGGQEGRAVADQVTGGDAELQPSADAAGLFHKPQTTSKDATQSTTEITSSSAIKNRKMKTHRRKTRWELYRERYEDFHRSLKEAARALAPGKGAWYLKNLKYWFCSCWSTTRADVLNAVLGKSPQDEELYPHLLQLIQEEERYQNVLKLRNYLVNNDFV